MSVAQGNGIWIGGEIRGSGNPAAHAVGIVETMKREGIDWACVQIEPDDLELRLMVAAAAGTRAVGGWSQNLDPATAVARMRLVPGATFFSINAEKQADEEKWATTAIQAMQAHCRDGVSLIFQQGAIDYKTPGDAKSWQSKAVAQRWIALGVEAIPEAIQSENPQATIAAMMELCSDLGWKPEDVAPALYLTLGYNSWHYNPQIALTNGRWSIYRYGDIATTDWEVINTWPRPAAEPPPTTPPPPPELPKMTVNQAHANTRYGVQAVRNNNVTLGPGASLSLQDRLALGALNGVHNATKGAQVAGLLDQLGYPKEGT